MNKFVPDPNRFEASKTTLLIDRFMNQFIKIGGISIIVVVAGIFVFIGWQIFPLFQSVKVTPDKVHQLRTGDEYIALGQDEYGELPFLVRKDGTVVAYDLSGGRPAKEFPAALPGTIVESAEAPSETGSAALTAISYNHRTTEILYGTQDGRFAKSAIQYTPSYGANYERLMEIEVVADSSWLNIGIPGNPLKQVAYGDARANQMAAAIQEVDGALQVHSILIERATTMLGEGEPEVIATFDLTQSIEGTPIFLLVNKTADGVFVGTREGAVYFFFRTDQTMELRQKFVPFEDTGSPELRSVDFLFGDTSLVMTNIKGENRIFSLFIPKGENTRYFGRTKDFPAFGNGAESYSPSSRNKAFLISSDQAFSLRFATTADVRYEEQTNFKIKVASLGLKYDSIFLLDEANQLHVYKLRDYHPYGSLKSMFTKIWYEGSNEPKYEWQSTGGSDDFEAKLSIIPLIIGTLKGTVYAMLFAVPIALLAAVYVSQFASPNVRRIVKPTMEVMASLPSVVLGFLAALWLAPLLETRVPSILLVCIFVPITALLMGQIWNQMSPRARIWMQGGHEWWFFLPVMFFVMWLGWTLGPILEQQFFVVTDPDTGMKIADFRRWWPAVVGADFQQRNSLVVGFVMGFAVIPIIFTITEDSLSNVPGALRSGSLALGASRWQTAMRIVLPTASAGIFSALMIGLGRAVGETMIVVMATGNTPIMEWNIFSGMRTLSANIAVELPEAAVGGTLYRALFLGAMVLFLMTFFVNTLAEVMRQHLREKYKLV
ncbi:MAG: ABC transporter permease subunit [Candidatus Methylacidiphilales bacterium]